MRPRRDRASGRLSRRCERGAQGQPLVASQRLAVAPACICPQPHPSPDEFKMVSDKCKYSDHSSSRAAEARLGQGANDLSQTCPLVRLPRNGGIKWHRLSAWRWLLIWGRLRCTDVGSQRHIKMCSTYCWCCSLRASQCRRQQHRRSSCSRVHSLPNRGHGAAMAPSHRA